jgi:Pyridoxamine 5'-phosphate oxidase
VRWDEFAEAAPELAEFGRRLFEEFTLVYLATVRADGGPRVHPLTITLADGDLYVFVVHGTPKCGDLLRDGRYALHSFPRFRGGTLGGYVDHEFGCSGRATPVADPATRAAVEAVHNDTVRPGDVLFRFDIERAFAKSRDAARRAVYTRWRAPTP